MTRFPTVAQAEELLAKATDQVVKDGGIIHEDAMWEAAEMALDGASKESIAERIKKARAQAYTEPYAPKGAFEIRGIG
jgi:hypothetical protein